MYKSNVVLSSEQLYVSTVSPITLGHLLEIFKSFDNTRISTHHISSATIPEFTDYYAENKVNYLEQLKIEILTDDDSRLPIFSLKLTNNLYTGTTISYEANNDRLLGLSHRVKNLFNEESSAIERFVVRHYKMCGIALTLFPFAAFLFFLASTQQTPQNILNASVCIGLLLATFYISTKMATFFEKLITPKVWLTDESRSVFHHLFAPTKANKINYGLIIISYILGFITNFLLETATRLLPHIW